MGKRNLDKVTILTAGHYVEVLSCKMSWGMPPLGVPAMGYGMAAMGYAPMATAVIRPPYKAPAKGPPLPAKDTSNPVTLYVSNIPTNVENDPLKAIFLRCGSLTSWNRVIGGDMKQKPCAFCTFGNPTSASRALILLNGVDFGPGTLVVKVDKYGQKKIDEVSPGLSGDPLLEQQCRDAVLNLVKQKRDAHYVAVQRKANEMTDMFLESMSASTGGPAAAADNAKLLQPPTLGASTPGPPSGQPPAMPPPSGPPPTSSNGDGQSEDKIKAQRKRERMDSDYRNALRSLRVLEDEREREKRHAAARAVENVERDQRALQRLREFEMSYDDEHPDNGDARYYRQSAVTRTRKTRELERKGWEAAGRRMELETTKVQGGEAAVTMTLPTKSSVGGAGRPLTAAKPTAPIANTIFNPDEEDEEEELERKKRRKLVKITYTDEQMRSIGIDPEEERRKKSREIINAIPTDRDALFAHAMHWSAMDKSLIDGRLKPWVDRKITEFIGAPEPSLVEFICGKVAARTPPQDIVSELVDVLDDEAEIFVMKMWRVVVYETEFKKAGL
eukprot:m.58214 g.58214  ORF g.58214 m.58214 type:complete len:558 (+) comp9400_c0_seq1:22-1695(+)